MLKEIFRHGIKPRGIIDEQCMSRIVERFHPARWIAPDRQPCSLLPLGRRMSTGRSILTMAGRQSARLMEPKQEENLSEHGVPQTSIPRYSPPYRGIPSSKDRSLASAQSAAGALRFSRPAREAGGARR